MFKVLFLSGGNIITQSNSFSSVDQVKLPYHVELDANDDFNLITPSVMKLFKPELNLDLFKDAKKICLINDLKAWYEFKNFCMFIFFKRDVNIASKVWHYFILLPINSAITITLPFSIEVRHKISSLIIPCSGSLPFSSLKEIDISCKLEDLLTYLNKLLNRVEIYSNNIKI